MAICLAHSLFILSLSVLTLVNPTPVYSFDKYFFIFGDGLYDPGNKIFLNPDEYLPSFHSPYGTTFFTGHPTGRYSDGRTVADFIAEKEGFPFLIPALNGSEDFTYGANFAIEGATVLDRKKDKTSLNLKRQVELFNFIIDLWKPLYNETEVKRRVNKAVYLISIGAQDYFDSVHFIGNHTFIVEKVVAGILDAIKALYGIGARKFVVQNVAQLGGLPFAKQKYGKWNEILAAYAETHRDELTRRLVKLIEEYPQLNYTVFNAYCAIGSLIDAPEDYGFKNGSSACCGNSTYRGEACGALEYEYCVCGNKAEYVFFDGVHNTDAANELLAEWMWNKTKGYVRPYGVHDFFKSSSDNSNLQIQIQMPRTQAARARPFKVYY
ncbi:GDSL esterase/lipase [Manihot esculenta]|uniref:Uncharacterized protein n=1 Tax=Manihot esculenta TaxID=3983 RepID=A0ACB7GU33_MANES|nr:GDSL esterase/lipase [Manihot esculenta]KAG8643178.1 hypothetical protein MANES_11G013950v8 [Manihot esculenta]